MQGRCERHLFETAEERCRECAFEFCADCLVYSFGPAEPPFCIPCAIAAAGIRAGAGYRPALGRRDMKRLHKTTRRERQRSAEPAITDPLPGYHDVLPPPPPPPVPRPAPLGWSLGIDDANTSLAS